MSLQVRTLNKLNLKVKPQIKKKQLIDQVLFYGTVFGSEWVEISI